jgi:hypothetical protein
MSALPIRGAFADKLQHATVFRAWRTNEGPARELDIGQPVDLTDAVSAATTHFMAHKDTLLIHEHDGARRKGMLHTFAIRQKAATWGRNPTTGASERVTPLYADKLFSVPVDAFEPTRTFDAFRDCPTGVDLTLVEG